MAPPSFVPRCHGPQYRTWLPVLAVCAVLGLVGCGRIDRARECQALTAAVNPALDAIEARQAAGPNRGAALADAAHRYDALANKVARLKFTNHGLAKTAKEYAEALREAARVSRRASSGLKRGRVNLLTRARAEMVPVKRKEKALARRLNRLCRAP